MEMDGCNLIHRPVQTALDPVARWFFHEGIKMSFWCVIVNHIRPTRLLCITDFTSKLIHTAILQAENGQCSSLICVHCQN